MSSLPWTLLWPVENILFPNDLHKYAHIWVPFWHILADQTAHHVLQLEKLTLSSEDEDPLLANLPFPKYQHAPKKHCHRENHCPKHYTYSTEREHRLRKHGGETLSRSMCLNIGPQTLFHKSEGICRKFPHKNCIYQRYFQIESARESKCSLLPPVVISPLAEVGEVPAQAFPSGVELGFSVVVTLKRSPLAEVTRFSLNLLRSEFFVSLLNLMDKVLGVR